MQLEPCAFNELLGSMGQEVLWYRSYRCPCVDQHSNAAKPGCPRCAARGVFFDKPVGCRIGVAGQRLQKQWANFGVYESGDMVCSLPSDTPAYDMAHGDRVVMLNAEDQFQLTLQRGMRDNLKPLIVTRVVRVFWLNQAGEIVEGGIPTVSTDGTLTFPAGAPPSGTKYTVVGYKRPDYHCWGEYPSDRGMHGGALLPRRVVLRSSNVAMR